MGGGFRNIKCRRSLLLGACVAVAVAVPVAAQTPGGSPGPSVDRRETIIGGTSQPGPTFERCVDVEVGNDKSFGCLNEKLRREVDRINPSLNLPPIDARSSDLRVGNVNTAAVRQQYGSNFGRSAFPFRPAAPNLVLPRR